MDGNNNLSSIAVFVSTFIIGIILNYTIEPLIANFMNYESSLLSITTIFFISIIIAMLYRIIELLNQKK